MTIKQFCHQFDNCKSTDGKYNLNKNYRFSYKNLIEDDRVCEKSLHTSWMKKIKKYDGMKIKIIDEDEGVIDNMSIARNWCEEIIVENYKKER